MEAYKRFLILLPKYRITIKHLQTTIDQVDCFYGCRTLIILVSLHVIIINNLIRTVTVTQH